MDSYEKRNTINNTKYIYIYIFCSLLETQLATNSKIFMEIVFLLINSDLSLSSLNFLCEHVIKLSLTINLTIQQT